MRNSTRACDCDALFGCRGPATQTGDNDRSMEWRRRRNRVFERRFNAPTVFNGCDQKKVCGLIVFGRGHGWVGRSVVEIHAVARNATRILQTAGNALCRMHASILGALLVGVLGAIAATKGVAAPPDVVVAADGSGKYTSLQEAISAAPMGTGRADPRWVILVKAGTYRERIYVQRERGNILVRGEDAARTLVTFDLHANLPGPDGKPIGTFRTPTLQIDGDGMIWEDITIANGAGPVGQALALRVDADRVIFRRCRFLGWQDTILLNRGRQYFEDCYVEGHVDFIFGGATAFFARCHLHAVGDGYLTAASTPEGTPHGFVFADGRITGAEGVKTYLGRPWRNYARTVFLRTEMSAVVRPAGWDNWNKPAAERTTFYAEHASRGPGAQPEARVPWAKRLTASEAAGYTPRAVLGGADGWDPTAP